jgi:PhzF family phenazine biosynthesis protein
MTTIKVRHVDTFSHTPQTGNPAGVVLDGHRVSEQQMASVARELNLPETAFVLTTARPEIDCKMRFFSPEREEQRFGHSAIAALHALAEEGLMGMSQTGSYTFRVDTPSGVLPFEVTKSDGPTTVSVIVAPPVLEKATQFKTDLIRLLNIQLSDFDNGKTIARNEVLYVGLKRLHLLFTLKPNQYALASFLASREIAGVCLFTTETVDRDSAVHSRFFTPHLASPEDPATCVTHASLALLLHEGGHLKPRDGRCLFQAEQGDAIGRRARIRVEMTLEEGRASSVKIGGNAVTVMRGEMIVND